MALSFVSFVLKNVVMQNLVVLWILLTAILFLALGRGETLTISVLFAMYLSGAVCSALGLTKLFIRCLMPE